MWPTTSLNDREELIKALFNLEVRISLSLMGTAAPSIVLLQRLRVVVQGLGDRLKKRSKLIARCGHRLGGITLGSDGSRGNSKKPRERLELWNKVLQSRRPRRPIPEEGETQIMVG